MPQIKGPEHGGLAMEVRPTRSSMVYTPGETMTGIVVLTWAGTENIICNGISCHFFGEAHTGFTGKNGKTKFSGKRPYFDYEKFILGSKPGPDSRKKNIAPGTSSFKYKFPLPKKLPASFEGPHGYVKYKIHAELKGATHPVHLPTTSHELYFTIIPYFPIASLPQASIPGEAISRETQFCLWFCATGHVNFATHIPKQAYIMGEDVPVTIEIDNSGGASRIEKIACGLILLADYIGEELRARIKHKDIHTEKKKSRHPAILIEGPPIEKGVKATWTVPDFKVPPNIPPTGLGGHCKLIDINYVVRVELTMPTGHPFGQEIPVKIGTKEKPEPKPKGGGPNKWSTFGMKTGRSSTAASKTK